MNGDWRRTGWWSDIGVGRWCRKIGGTSSCSQKITIAIYNNNRGKKIIVTIANKMCIFLFTTHGAMQVVIDVIATIKLHSLLFSIKAVLTASCHRFQGVIPIISI